MIVMDGKGRSSIRSSELIRFLAGGIPGCVAKTCVAPLDRIKILLQAHNPHYSGQGPMGTAIGIWRGEGLRGFFKGNGAQMVRIYPYSAVQFYSYEYFKKVWKRTNSRYYTLFAGSSAGICSVVATYPLDLTRARLAFQVGVDKLRFRGIIDCLSRTASEEGIRGLYRGFVPTLVGMVPYAGDVFSGGLLAKDAYLIKFL